MNEEEIIINDSLGNDILIDTPYNGEENRRAYSTKPWPSDQEIYGLVPESGGDEPTPEPEQHEYVDLGLPSGTLWATCNIGANSPEEAGMYFAWGETSGYTAEQVGVDKNFTWEDYQWGNYESGTLVTDSLIDENNNLKPEYDAATVNWGEGYRMPTKEEFEELRGNTTFKTEIINGIKGFLFTSKSNANTIFIPLTNTKGGGTSCRYHLSSLNTVYIMSSYNAHFVSDNEFGNYTETDYAYRCMGTTVRPVRTN